MVEQITNKKAVEIIDSSKNNPFKDLMNQHFEGTREGASEFVRGFLSVLNNMSSKLRNATESRVTRYSSEINPYLYSDNSFIMRSQNDAGFAASGEVTRLSDSNSGPAVTKGRFQAKTLNHLDNAPKQTVVVRKNTGQDWFMEYFHTAPTALSSLEKVAEVAYNARQEELQSHAGELQQATANYTAVEWASGDIAAATTVNPSIPTIQFVFTSGSARPTSVVGGSGNVKKIALADIKAVKTQMFKTNLMNGNLSGRMYMLPSPDEYNDLLDIPEFVDYEKTGRESRLLKGEVGTILDITVLAPRYREDWGANVLYSYTALATTTDLTKVEDTAVSGANMASASLFWTEKQVKRAQGTALVFPWLNSPEYLSDVYAVEQRYSAIKKRLDEKGVISLVINPF